MVALSLRCNLLVRPAAEPNMPISTIYIPMSRELYDDIVRFSDGALDPAALAENQLENWIARDLEFGDGEHWGERFAEVAGKYAPHVLQALDAEQEEALARLRQSNRPLVWKEVSIPAGSDVRMAYAGTHQYAKVERGSIVDEGVSYSPSEWASKVAGGTSRNAWRDLWFRQHGSKDWLPAQALRDQARRARSSSSAGAQTEEGGHA
jgi:hypothetical protein